MRWWSNLVLLIIPWLSKCLGDPEPTLAFVFAVGRHGHRSPAVSIYPPEEYEEKVAKYFPEGLGQITKAGKQLMYKVGEALKRRYANFLGTEYQERKFLCTSSESSRSVVSAMLVCAAMFPPQGSQVWSEDIQWQPIPVFTDTNDFDKHHVLYNKAACPSSYQKISELRKGLLTPDTSSENQQLFQFLTNKLRQNITSAGWVAGIHDFLDCQEGSTGTLPEWAKEVYPEKTLPSVIKLHKTFSEGRDMQQLFGGPMLREIKGKLQAKADGKLVPNRLMQFHASNGSVLRPVLVTLGFNDTLLIRPGDILLFELHVIESSFKVKILYFRPVENLTEFVEMPLNGCNPPCNLGKFFNLAPSDTSEAWYSRHCVIPDTPQSVCD